MPDDIDVCELAQCTCLRLRRAARRATQIYDHQLAPAGLTIGQLGLLAQLHGASLHGGGGLSIGALSERRGLDPTTLTRNLKPLKAHGLVADVADPSDRRVRAVAITRKGRGKLREAVPLWRRAQAEVERMLGVEATVALNGLLELSVAKLAK